MRKILSSLLRGFISIFFIILLLYIMRDKYPQILKALASTKVLVLVMGFLMFVAAIAIASIRFKLLVDAQEIAITFKEALSLTFIGYFFNNFLPTSIGGDVVKAYYLSKNTDKKAASYASVFVDRVLGLVTMIFMALIALFFVKEGVVDNTIKYIVYAVSLCSIFAIVFMTNKRLAKKFSFLLFLVKPIKEKLKKLYEIVHRYQYRQSLIWKSLVISFVSQILFFMSFGTMALSLGGRIPIRDLFIKIPIISMLSLLPSINGLGLREGSTVVFFGPIIGQDKAFAISILWLVLLLCTSVIGGIIYGLSPQFKIKLNAIKKMDY